MLNNNNTNNYLLWELVLLQLFEYPESDILVLVVPDSDSISILDYISKEIPKKTITFV